MIWGFGSGIPLGIAAFVSTLFGSEAHVSLGFGAFTGVWAGFLLIPLTPIFCAFFGAMLFLLYPVFKLSVSLLRGPKLRFRTAERNCLLLSRISLFSYLKLSLIFGILFGLLQDAILAMVLVAGGKGISVAGIPPFFDGMAQILVIPILYGIYSAMIAVFAFIPFRFCMSMMHKAVIPSQEIDFCDRSD